MAHTGYCGSAPQRVSVSFRNYTQLLIDLRLYSQIRTPLLIVELIFHQLLTATDETGEAMFSLSRLFLRRRGNRNRRSVPRLMRVSLSATDILPYIGQI